MDTNGPGDRLCLANGWASWPSAACKARFEVGARSALRELTRGGCLNAANAVSEVSSAARPRTEHRSAVGAKRRPPQHEPAPGVACRDALTCAQSGHSRTTASGRKQTPKFIPTFHASRVARGAVEQLR